MEEVMSQEKELRKAQAYLDQRGLSNLHFDNLTQVIRIRNALWGTAFSNGINAFIHDQGQMTFNIAEELKGIIEQNWLLIKQNDELRTQNEKLISLLEDKFSSDLAKISFNPELPNNQFHLNGATTIQLHGTVPAYVKKINVYSGGNKIATLNTTNGNFTFIQRVIVSPLLLSFKANDCEERKVIVIQ